MFTNKNNLSENNIKSLVLNLDNKDGLKRQQARLELVRIGKAAVPTLINALQYSNQQVRWEAAEALASMPDVRAAPALVKGLEDEDVSIRWATSRALIALQRAGMPALLLALVKRFNSARLRQGARHILRTFKRKGFLNESEVALLKALESFMTGAEDVPWLAEKATKALTRKQSIETRLKPND